jgi:hypothetical protein
VMAWARAEGVRTSSEFRIDAPKKAVELPVYQKGCGFSTAKKKPRPFWEEPFSKAWGVCQVPGGMC